MFQWLDKWKVYAEGSIPIPAEVCLYEFNAIKLCKEYKSQDNIPPHKILF